MNKKISKIKIIFALTFILLVLTLAFSTSGATYTDTTGVTWTFTTNTAEMTATITGVNLSSKTSEFTIPSAVTDGTNTYTVTSIGNSAFKDKKTVFGKLTIPNTVMSIGSSAFAGTYIFGTVEIPESVTYIGSSAFENCDGITEVTLPSGVDVIETNTFKDCFALSKVNTENIVSFKDNSFYNCPAIHKISFGKNATSIGSNAFYNCDALDGVLDISMVTSLANNAFSNCDRIKGFVFPDGKYNSNGVLVEYDIASFISQSCASVEEYYVTENNLKYSCANGAILSKDKTTIIYYPKLKKDAIFTTPDTVTTIGKNAFNGTVYLETVLFTENVTTLEEQAFVGASITYMYVPESIRVVNFDTFMNCKKLKWIVFSDGVKVIGVGALSGTDSIELVIVRNEMATLPASKADTYYASEYTCVDHLYGYIDVAPTCTESGYNRCIICDRYELVKATNHSGAILEEIKATCTTDGYRVVECFECNETVKTVTEPALGHISNGKIHNVPAGFKSPAYAYSTCSVCKQMYIAEYNANFYLLGDVNCDGKINYFDLSALKTYLDSNDDSAISTANSDIMRDGEIDIKDLSLLTAYLTGKIDSLPESSIKCTSHGRKTTIEIIKPSCDSNGFRIRYCTNCGILTDEINSASLEHTLENTFVINSSCSLTGQKISHCTTCDKQIIETIDTVPHVQSWYTAAGQRGYEYSTCALCGKLESRRVDYSVYDSLIGRIPKYYNIYYQPETIVLIEPVKKNYDLALTQAEVDENVRILADALANAQYKVYDAPAVFVEDAPKSQGLQEYEPTRIVVAYLGEDGKTHIEAIDYNAQIKVRGNTTAGHTSKLPFNIKFSSKVDLFDMGASKKYCLLSNLNDNTYIRNALVFELSQRLGIDYTCKYKFVDLYTNGEYRGSYMLTTSVDVGEDRVDIDEVLDYLIEIEYSFTKDADECFYFETNGGNPNPTPIFKMRLLVNDPEKADMTGESFSRLHTLISQIEFAIYSGDWELIQQFVDVDSLAKYFILHETFKEIDIFWDSTRFYIEDGKLHGGPAWDFDLSMIYNGGGGQGESSAHSNTNGYVCEGGVAGDSTTGVWASIEWKYAKDNQYRLWFCALYKHSPDFVKLVCEYVDKYSDVLTLLTDDKRNDSGKVVEENVIDSIIYDEEVEGSFIRNRNKFGTLKQDYDKNVKAIREWLQKRVKWMQTFYAQKLETLK